MEYTRKLIALRKKEDALRQGDFVEVQSHNPVYAYLRTQGNTGILMIFNNSAKPHPVSFPLGTKQWADCELFDLLSAQTVKTTWDAGQIVIEPFGARVLRVSD